MGAEREIRLIVNADDLGWTEGVNRGIFRSHREGILTSATLAANMPAAEGAVASLREYPELGVGVHLNACQGPPLSNLGKDVLAWRTGVLDFTATRLIWRCVLLRYETLVSIEDEFEAQIRWCLEHGLRPTHADTHRHLHAWPAIFRIVARLCRRYHIPFTRRHRERLPRELLRKAPTRQRRLSGTLNLLGRLNYRKGREFQPTEGTLGVAHTGLVDTDFLLAAVAGLPAGVTELMVHPGYTDGLDAGQTRLRESRQVEMDALCDPRVREEIARRGVVLTNYGRIR